MMRKSLMVLLITSVFGASAHAAQADISFSKKWTFTHGLQGNCQLAEIPAYDPKTHTIWVAGAVGVDVLDARDGSLIEHIDVTGYGYVNGVAIKDGVAAFAVEASSFTLDGECDSTQVGDRRNPGHVLFYSTKNRQPFTRNPAVEVGALPDMLTFTPNGNKLIVANEGTPNLAADEDYDLQNDPAGTVSIIDVKKRRLIATVGLDSVPTSGSALRDASVVGMDYEPEYVVAVSNDKAYVTLQEANAIAELDIKRKRFNSIVGLGVKDFTDPDNYIDPNDKDSKIELRSADVVGLYQPDSIVSYKWKGKTFLVMANEGDTREDEVDKARVDDDSDLDRLNISTVDSTETELVTFGARSFSIRDTRGNLIYDSGNILDAEAIRLEIYADGRSDDKGVEPEGLALHKIKGRTYAFVGLERTTKSAVAVFDVTNPYEVEYIDMIVSDGDVSPEGLVTFEHRGKHYLAFSNEVSMTTTLYEMSVVKQPR